jgi:cytochrome P450
MADEPSLDPYRPFRDSGDGVFLGDFDGEAIPVLLRYRDVRMAAKDWQRLSNDAPGRVPIPAETDIRSLRQLPIEIDPPAHGAYKDLVKGWFRRPVTDPDYAPQIAGIVHAALDRHLDGAPFEATADLGLPIQSRALAVLLGLPQDEAEEWISWGTHAFRVGGRNIPEKAAVLDRTNARHVDRALADPSGPDMFSHLARARLDGRPLTRDEIAGFLHVTFAGGRDTVIGTLVGALAHLAEHPDDLRRLRDQPALLTTATEEVVRHISPLTFIGRVCPREDSVGGHPRAPGERVALCWGAANLDPTVFDAPEELRIDRSPNPHVAFGSGDHNCIGSTHARLVLRTFLEALTQRVGTIRILEAVPASKSIGGLPRLQGFKRLLVEMRH